jgi:multimeric flavodoxin WrbA
MIILGILGSPRVNGICSRLLQEALAGAENQGATVQRDDLIKKNSQHCMGCCKCLFDDPALPIGRCPLKDDMAALLEEYIHADGYILASPVYDTSITALMKKFLERKMPLSYRPEDTYATIGSPRTPWAFKKKALMIVTGNCGDEYRELMGEPCFEMMEGQFRIEQVETIDKFYVGGVENMPEKALRTKLQYAHRMGRTLVDRIAAEDAKKSFNKGEK